MYKFRGAYLEAQLDCWRVVSEVRISKLISKVNADQENKGKGKGKVKADHKNLDSRRGVRRRSVARLPLNDNGDDLFNKEDD